MRETLSERTKHEINPERKKLMNIMFVCTDNFTRSVIAEFCLKDYLQRINDVSINVCSSGVRASSEISKYSNLHFDIMESKGIKLEGFTRTQFTEECFDTQDIIVGMSELHRDYIKQEYNRTIPLFNEMYNGTSLSVNIGSPEEDDFAVKMEELVNYIRDAMPVLYKKINERNL
ncbi:hypothetical protein FE782_22620 [Paenibacillus antri]|uniref:Phosphotyrosine protein phosphatase I domain-containing protein n=1 Tax=Paenibacillus antri TaxID=2582848 RepID=A0A5R9GEI7_9BACL|nr:hypothetical protein [Paenibacillus antri]TLS49805.1 hypothetical protein FE782_22620 [Paenibacillus antri]